MTAPAHNALARASSSYLRSAMHQPIQWQEWGEEAFATDATCIEVLIPTQQVVDRRLDRAVTRLLEVGHVRGEGAAARDEEKGAQQKFKDALTRLKELTHFEGGELEQRYRQLQSDYDNAASRVAAVHKRVQDVETVAGDLFVEWEGTKWALT